MRIQCLLTSLMLASTFACRPSEDPFEPNDALAEATPLPIDGSLEARAVQDDSDFFATSVDADRRLVFRFEGRGESEEERHAYSLSLQLFAPSGEQLADLRSQGREDKNCNISTVEFTSSCDNELGRGPSRWTVTIPKTDAGTYGIAITELAAADNQFPFSWDYTVTATASNES